LRTEASRRAHVEVAVRRDAVFTCHGDGLCCTDAHLLGPLRPSERALVSAIEPRAVVRLPRQPGHYLATTRAGACVFLEGATGKTPPLCALHARLGEPAKPRACRRFPFALVRTPLGTRAITDHRCPCRTMGERAAVRSEDVPRGPASVATGRIALDRSRRVAFATYARDHEAPLLDALLAGGDPVSVLGAPFPALDGLGWTDVAEHFRAMKDGSPVGTASGEALVAFGDTLRHLAQQRRGAPPVRARPWAPAFDRAEARTPNAGAPRAMLADFLADELWSLDFALRGTTLAEGRAELATRAAVAQAYAGALVTEGVRSDRAMAEAILVAELAGRSELWAKVATQLRVD